MRFDAEKVVVRVGEAVRHHGIPASQEVQSVILLSGVGDIDSDGNHLIILDVNSISFGNQGAPVIVVDQCDAFDCE